MSNKKVAVKKTAKKEAPKKVATKKVAVKKAVKKEAPKKAVAKKSATGNKELDLMLATIKEATKKGAKKVVVYTTSKESHKPNTGSGGFGVDDLKPKIYEAYKHLLCKFDVKAKLVNASEMAVEWSVNIKK
jgi:adenylate kinase